MPYGHRIPVGAFLVAVALAQAGPVAGQSGWSVPSRPVTVTYWDGVENVKNELMIKKLIPEYQKLNPQVTIKYETISGLSYKLSVALSTGTASTIFTLPDFLLPAALEVGALEPLPPAAWGQTNVAGVVDTYLPRLLDAAMDGGKLYAIPDQMNAHSLYINNRLFREAGLDPVKDAPRTWDDVARLNPLLTKRQGDRIVQKGWEMRYAGEHWLARMFLILLYQGGADALKDGKPAFNGEAGVKALQIWKTLTVAPKVTQNTLAAPYQDFAVEQDAMTFAGPNAGASIEKINPKMKDAYTVAPLPAIAADRPRTIVYSYNWAVNAKASDDQKKAAWDFIHYCAIRPAEWMAVAKYLQPVKGWYDTPAARQTPFLNVFIHDLSVGKPMPQTKHYTELQASLARMIERVIFNNADPKQALDQAAEEYNRAAKS
jgi:multiple sugar transport system substrate-binding protein